MNSKIKLGLIIAFTSIMLLIQEPFILSLISVLMLIFSAKAGLMKKIFEWIKPLIAVFFLILLLQSFTYSGLGFSAAGFFWGITIALRLVSIILAIFMFVYTTKPRDIALAFSFLPRPMPFIMTLSLGLVPGVKREYMNIINSQKTRGLSFRSLNISRTYLPVLVPLFAKTLDKSQRMALAMETRGMESEK